MTIENYGGGRMLKETVVVYFKALAQKWHERTKENHEKLQSG
jgi:hypothetical protein